jgi:hypothetical protein
MIARIWKGVVQLADADVHADHIRAAEDVPRSPAIAPLVAARPVDRL